MTRPNIPSLMTTMTSTIQPPPRKPIHLRLFPSVFMSGEQLLSVSRTATVAGKTEDRLFK